MTFSINTNLASMLVQHSLDKSTNALNNAIEKMTTGFRINSAKDDAAGYAIAKGMDVKLSSYEVASENVAMANSLISTATSSMDILQTHLQRVRDLSEQAANGTYGDDSRQAIQTEINQRVEEIAGKLFADKVRGETSTWITVHSCVYDLDKKIHYVRTQEEETEYMFKM